MCKLPGSKGYLKVIISMQEKEKLGKYRKNGFTLSLGFKMVAVTPIPILTADKASAALYPHSVPTM